MPNSQAQTLRMHGCAVGGVYDEAACRFDHHQRGFEHVFGHGYNTKLSSAGLVYKVNQGCGLRAARLNAVRTCCSMLPYPMHLQHYGKQVVASILGLPMDHPDMDTVYLQVWATQSVNLRAAPRC